jgi:hypothetical protein
MLRGNKFSIRIKDKAGNYVNITHLDTDVKSFSKSYQGGCQECTITLYGKNLIDLQECMRFLDYDVEVFEDTVNDVWWGFVNELEIDVLGSQFKLRRTLDGMYNRIRVSYTDKDTEEPAFTDWVEDADSIAKYGVFEIQQNTSATTLSDANAMRDKALQMLRFPIRDVEVTETAEISKVTLKCLGHINTLKRKMYELKSGEEKYTDEGNIPRHRAFGWGDSVNYVTKAAQRIKLEDSESFYATTISVILSRRDTTELCRIELCADDNDAYNRPIPGAVLAYTEINPEAKKTDVPEFDSFEWITKRFVLGYTVQPDTYYWIVLSKVGPNNTIKQFYVRGNRKVGYPRGHSIMYIRDNQYNPTPNWAYNTWLTPYVRSGNIAADQAAYTDAQTSTSGNNYDMCFILKGEWEYSRQIQELIERSAYLTVIMEAGLTNKNSHPMKDGSENMYEVLMNLVKIGTSTGKDIMFHVTKQKVCEFYAETEKEDYKYQIKDGNLYDRYGTPLSWSVCPLGWVKLKDHPLFGYNYGLEENHPYVFVTRCEYDCKDGVLTMLETREAKSPWEKDSE